MALAVFLIASQPKAQAYDYERIVDDGYTFVVMPDTQNMVYSYPEVFVGAIDGIIKDKDRLNTQALLHVGDIVNHHHLEDEFILAASQLEKIPAASIKTVLTPGNHDYTWVLGEDGQRLGVSDMYYSKYFGPGSDFDELTPYFKKESPSTRSGYALVETPGSYDYLVVSVSWYDIATNPEEILWLEEVLRTNTDTPTIIISHNIVRPDRDNPGQIKLSHERDNISDILWSTIKKYDQVFMCFSGHHAGSGHMAMENDLSNPVHFILSDYQFSYRGGNGYVEIVEFDESANKIHINTSSPYLRYLDPSDITEDDIINGNAHSLDFDFAARFDNLPKSYDYSFHWAKEPVEYVLAGEIMYGEEDGSFRPEDMATRYEVVQALARLEDIQKHHHSGSSLPDVDSNYMSYVNWAIENEVVLGYEDNTFQGENKITREEIAAILNRYVNNLDKDIESFRSVTYKDIDQVSDWAIDEVQEASNRGLLSGRDDGLFDPRSNITRGELAQIIVNINK